MYSITEVSSCVYVVQYTFSCYSLYVCPDIYIYLLWYFYYNNSDCPQDIMDPVDWLGDHIYKEAEEMLASQHTYCYLYTLLNWDLYLFLLQHYTNRERYRTRKCKNKWIISVWLPAKSENERTPPSPKTLPAPSILLENSTCFGFSHHLIVLWFLEVCLRNLVYYLIFRLWLFIIIFMIICIIIFILDLLLAYTTLRKKEHYQLSSGFLYHL